MQRAPRDKHSLGNYWKRTRHLLKNNSTESQNLIVNFITDGQLLFRPIGIITYMAIYKEKGTAADTVKYSSEHRSMVPALPPLVAHTISGPYRTVSPFLAKALTCQHPPFHARCQPVRRHCCTTTLSSSALHAHIPI